MDTSYLSDPSNPSDHAPVRPSLVLLNGPPGVGKSTVASALAATRPLAFALDIDAIRHRLGLWQGDEAASGRQARRLAVAMIRQHLGDGHDVIVGQYLARPEFIETLEATAEASEACFVEVVLSLSASQLADRLGTRRDCPDRPEHAINNALVGPDDAAQLTASIERIVAIRPQAAVVVVTGTPDRTTAAVRTLLGW